MGASYRKRGSGLWQMLHSAVAGQEASQPPVLQALAAVPLWARPRSLLVGGLGRQVVEED